jgi:trans-2,3-dihydro-3-hydroxyanthranilate isomerase
MRCRYYICDVFTDTRFGGNQLAVFPEAEGLSDTQLQQIAREFNFSETTFVFPPRMGHTCKVRIFTPTSELPFAGHPNIGTAFVLAASGALGMFESPHVVTFEETAGSVSVSIHRRNGRRIWCELTAPQRLSLGRTVSAESVAKSVSLAAKDIISVTHPPQVASVGLPFLFAELGSYDGLKRARPDLPGFEALVAEGVEAPFVFLYIRATDGFDIRARMFSPLDGIPEDPATGSASCALAGLLSHCDTAASGSFSWRIAQGVEMGRPSLLEARAEKKDGVVMNAWIGGECALFSDGFIDV